MKIRYWKKLERHPLSAEYPDLTGATWQGFVDNLKKYGNVSRRKIVLHEGKVLDGWQFYRACIEADVKPEFQALPKGTTPEVFVETMQDYRRHETQDKAMQRIAERRERVAAARAEGKSSREIAIEEGVSQPTVLDDIASGENGLSPDSSKTLETDGANGQKPAAQSDTGSGRITGRDGKSYPATKPILCERCKRVGPTEDCDACKELRKEIREAKGKPGKREPGDDTESEAAAAAEENGKPKRGAPLFDWKEYEKHLGPVARGPDTLAKAYKGEKGSDEYRDCHKHLNNFIKTWQAWHKRLGKVAVGAKK